MCDGFFTLSFEDWFLAGVKHAVYALQFGLVTWLCWKYRNECGFQQTVASCDQLRLRVLHWIAGVRETMRMGSTVCPETRSSRTEVSVCWSPEPGEWFTLNSDGSVDANGRAAAGGVIRNEHGDISIAFAMNLGKCSITRAELRGILEGMKLAWSKGIRKLAIQTDSLCALQLLHTLESMDHQHAAILLQFNELSLRDWEIKLSHVFREGNVMADSLANEDHSLPFCSHLIDEDHPAVVRWTTYDRLRSSQS
ncbi:Putative ribonuclease H protein At1g65750 [Linum grandiflorum]